jgi:2-polyprenyl-3-methyl-5-hydroxy-6-metoxy-1,4-benzoquinol methylase
MSARLEPGAEPGVEPDVERLEPAPGYRERIYSRYVSAFKGELPAAEQQAALERHARFFDHLFAPLLAAGRPRRVLEVGCGAGPFLHWAVTRGIPEVRGFDLSAEQVAAAERLGLPAEVASYRDALPRQRSWDWIVALDLIEHLTRDEALELLDLCHAALAPGGTLILTTPNGAGLRPGPVAHGDLTHETIFTPQTLTLALRLAGFGAVRVREAAPPPTGWRSRLRGLLWRGVRLAAMAVDLIETGSAGSRIYSRVMAVEARRER